MVLQAVSKLHAAHLGRLSLYIPKPPGSCSSSECLAGGAEITGAVLSWGLASGQGVTQPRKVSEICVKVTWEPAI